MELLNPLMLWGGLAIAIPIILHFWHQKKGKVIDWAATQWLIEKNLQQSRGVRLDNILLLLLRCLLILLLCFFLSKPLINWSNNQSATKKIHLIQPNNLIVNNFKFELEEAQKKGEKLYWIQAKPIPIEDLSQLPVAKDFNPIILQSCLNQMAVLADKEHLEIYFINQQGLARGSNIFIPNEFNLHTVNGSLSKTPKPFLAFANNQKLFVNAANQLVGNNELDRNGRYVSNAIHNNTINVLLLNTDKTERQTIAASLKALAEVYQIEINIDPELSSTKKYDWVFSNKVPSKSEVFSPSTLFILSNSFQVPNSQLDYQKNIINIPFSLSPQTSELVFNGELPEWLGEILVQHYQLNPVSYSLSQQQLNSLFRYAGHGHIQEESEFSKIILLTFIIILGIERYIAIRKNA
ncbi:BatA domain-containing protein [Emticicia sp. BO119]|uniref:BatA domain-containing protein n=1 Tax=Emticicia sp. BO119 TaxID=2757768 RepID=UPI0015F06F91|nr:BatA domain-containing protein [Emticicia sp. BO119]MBA4852734.1 BatA domain-containing protein [Emticicia sp. BO119]